MTERDVPWTKGPWAVDYGPAGGGHVPSLQVASGVEVVCGWWSYDATTRANALLIAAAPDLYAALKAAAARLERLGDVSTPQLLAARAALAKARSPS